MKNPFSLWIVAAGVMYGCGSDPAFHQVSRDTGAGADPSPTSVSKTRGSGDANVSARGVEAPSPGGGPSEAPAAGGTDSPNVRKGVAEGAPSGRGVVENAPEKFTPSALQVVLAKIPAASPENDESRANQRGKNEEGQTQASATEPTAEPSPVPRVVPEEIPTRFGTTEGANPIPVIVCSQFLEVPASSNPWLAGAPKGTQFGYSGYTDTIDRAPSESPPLHQSNCISPDKKLVFETQSTAKHFNGSFVQQGEGKVDEIATFVLGAVRGLSGLTAPIDSLVAVFLSDEYDGPETPPATLNFSSASARNFNELRPKLRQVFFIGDGRTDDGHLQKFVVPSGSTRLAFGDMDAFEWNNNVGSHRVRVNEALP